MSPVALRVDYLAVSSNLMTLMLSAGRGGKVRRVWVWTGGICACTLALGYERLHLVNESRLCYLVVVQIMVLFDE